MHGSKRKTPCKWACSGLSDSVQHCCLISCCIVSHHSRAYHVVHGTQQLARHVSHRDRRSQSASAQAPAFSGPLYTSRRPSGCARALAWRAGAFDDFVRVGGCATSRSPQGSLRRCLSRCLPLSLSLSRARPLCRAARVPAFRACPESGKAPSVSGAVERSQHCSVGTGFTGT